MDSRLPERVDLGKLQIEEPVFGLVLLVQFAHALLVLQDRLPVVEEEHGIFRKVHFLPDRAMETLEDHVLVSQEFEVALQGELGGFVQLADYGDPVGVFLLAHEALELFHPNF